MSASVVNIVYSSYLILGAGMWFKMLSIMMFVLLVFTCTDVFSMESMTSDEMSYVSGQAGVTIAFDGKTTFLSEFTSIAWGDPDGIGDGSSSGWLIIEGVGSTDEASKTRTIISFKDSIMTFDVGTANTGGLNLFGDSTSEIPENTSFIKIGLPSDIQMTSIGASEYKISLNNELNDGSQSALGNLRITDMRGELISNPDNIYIFPH